MPNAEKVGKIIKSIPESLQIDWIIKGFARIVKRENVQYVSPSFSFADASWRFVLWTKSYLDPGYMTLYLNSNHPRKFVVEYDFGLRTKCGDVFHVMTGYVEEDGLWSELRKFVALPDLLRRKSLLVPSGVLTITCRLSRRHRPDVGEGNFKKLRKISTLSNNFKDLFADKESCDTILKLNQREFKAHRTVLIARSPVFAAMFKYETLEKQNGIVTVQDCDSDTFEKFLEFLYCGTLDSVLPHEAPHLYETSEKYNVEELKMCCAKYLAELLTMENTIKIACLAYKYSDAALLAAAGNCFNHHLSEVLETSDWKDLLENDSVLANKLLEVMSKIKCEE